MALKLKKDELDKMLNNYLEEFGEKVRDDAKEIVPVKTGKLRDSIIMTKEGKEGKEVNVETSCGYGLWVENNKDFLKIALLKNIEG